MCSTKLSLEVFSRWFDYIMTEWTGMVSLQSMYGGQSGYFYKVTDVLYCTQGVLT